MPASLLNDVDGVQVTPALCGLSGDVTNAEDGFMQMQCSDGYHGPACTLCVRNSTHSFGRTGGLKCHACQRPALIIGGYIGSTLLVMLYLCYNIHTTLQENTVDVQGPVETVKVSELLRVCPGPLSFLLLLCPCCCPFSAHLPPPFPLPPLTRLIFSSSLCPCCPLLTPTSSLSAPSPTLSPYNLSSLHCSIMRGGRVLRSYT